LGEDPSDEGLAQVLTPPQRITDWHRLLNADCVLLRSFEKFRDNLALRVDVAQQRPPNAIATGDLFEG
ncbi:MAG: hypothetical protein WA970_15790, partial [Gammaproteobacteria bacterium]